jgi:hypothetical protein
MYCLSIHAGSPCEHAGARCTAGWHIPAEPPVVAPVTLHFGSPAHGRFLDLVAVVAAIHVHAAVVHTRIARQLDRRDTPREFMLQASRDTDLLMVHLSDSRALARLITQES